MKNTLILAEPLHIVFQGEGKNLGKKMILLRLVGCNIQCPDCDSIYTWKANKEIQSQYIKYNLTDLVKDIKQWEKTYHIHHLLITGGEPYLWEKQLIPLMESLQGCKFDIETSGYGEWSYIKNHKKLLKNIQFNISPKIGSLHAKSSIDPWKIKILENPPPHYIVKIVVSAKRLKEEYENIERLRNIYQIPKKNIYLMPFAKTREELLQQIEDIVNFCIENQYELSPRLHILMFDRARLK